MLLYLFALISVSTLFYLVGHFVHLFFRNHDESPDARVFSKMCVGMVLIVSLYAIIHTGLKSQLMGVFPLAVLAFYYYYSKGTVLLNSVSTNILKFEFKSLAISFIYICIAFAFFVYVYRVAGDNAKEIPSDQSYYSAISVHLQESSIENFNFSENTSLQNGSSFYHYFELWLNAFIYSSFGLTALHSLAFCVYPLFVGLILLGSFTITSRYFKNRWITFILSFFLLFVSSFPLLLQPVLKILNISPSLNFSVLGNIGVKVGIIYICLIWAFVNVKRDTFTQLLPIALCSVLYQTTLPAITCGFISVFIYEKYICKKTDYYILILGVLPAILIGLFYTYFAGHPVESAYGLSNFINDRIASMSSFKFVKLSIGNILELFLTRIIPFAPFAILIFVTWKQFAHFVKTFNTSILVIAFTILSSIMAYGLIFGVQDSTQSVTNFLYPSLSLILFVYLIIVLRYESLIIRLFASLILMLSFYFNQDFVFAANKPFVPRSMDSKSIDLITKTIDNKLFTSAYIKNRSSYKSIFSKNIDYEIPYSNFRRMTNSYTPTCLSLFSFYPLSSNEERVYAERRIVNSPYFQFVKQRNLDGENEQTKSKFLEELKIDYLFVEYGHPFLDQLGYLPVSKIVLLPDSAYYLVKFDWNKHHNVTHSH